MGLIAGYLRVRSGSLWPCIALALRSGRRRRCGLDVSSARHDCRTHLQPPDLRKKRSKPPGALSCLGFRIFFSAGCWRRLKVNAPVYRWPQTDARGLRPGPHHRRRVDPNPQGLTRLPETACCNSSRSSRSTSTTDPMLARTWTARAVAGARWRSRWKAAQRRKRNRRLGGGVALLVVGGLLVALIATLASLYRDAV